MSETLEEVPTTNLRGPLSKMKLVVQDKAGNSYYASFSKDDFEVYPDTRTVEVYKGNMEIKRFIKSFLTIKKVLVIEKKKLRTKF